MTDFKQLEKQAYDAGSEEAVLISEMVQNMIMVFAMLLVDELPGDESKVAVLKAIERFKTVCKEVRP